MNYIYGKYVHTPLPSPFAPQQHTVMVCGEYIIGNGKVLKTKDPVDCPNCAKAIRKLRKVHVKGDRR